MSGTGDGRGAGPWPWVVLALGVLLAGAFGAWLVTRTLERVPRAVAEEGRRAIRDVATVARAFRQGTVTHLFLSTATTVEGTRRLQVATLSQTESWQLEEDATAFWGTVPLGEVAVRATAPVQTTYFVDLDGTWRFDLRDDTVVVHAPPLRFNKPAIDASRIRYQVVRGNLLRDEAEVAARLKRELSGRSAIRARENVPLVRDTARRQIEGFVRTWLLSQFADAERYRVEVVFPGDDSAPVPPPDELPPL